MKREFVRDRRVWLGALAGVVLLAIVVAATVWLPRDEEEPRSRQYRDDLACLLTGADGVAGPEAAAVWAGMQEASESTLVRVRYLEVNEPQTVDNARGLLGSLVLGGCELVFAVGPAQVEATMVDADTYLDVSFVLVGGGEAGGNVRLVEAAAPEAVSGAVSGLVAELGASADS